MSEFIERDFKDAYVRMKERAVDRKELLKEVAVTMRHARTFITSREKMHPTGVELYDQLLAEIRIEIGETD